LKKLDQNFHENSTLVGCLYRSASETPILGADTVRLHPRGIASIFSFRNADIARGGFPANGVSTSAEVDEGTPSPQPLQAFEKA
jgi:hypothetical protein